MLGGMDDATARRIAAMDLAQRQALFKEWLAQQPALPLWQRATLAKRLEEWRLVNDGTGDWDDPRQRAQWQGEEQQR